MTIYPYIERDKAYAVMEQTQDLIDLVERMGTGKEAHDADLQAVIATMTGASDLKRQHESLNYMLDKLKEHHMSRIIAAAPTDFTAYVEAIEPNQPARSKVHRFLGETLMNMEDNKVAVSMPPGHAKDLCVSTPVLMGDGSTKRLGDVEVGDFVITHTGASREVLAVHNQGVRDTLNILTSSGRTLRPHPDHPFLTPAGWIPAKDLVNGDVLAQQREFSISNTSGRTMDEFALAGYMMAYGFIRNKASSRIQHIDLRFRTDDPIIMEDVIEITRKLGYKGRLAMGMSYGEEVRTIEFREPFRFWLEKNNLWKASRHEMRIPDWVFKGSYHDIGAFLGAIFSMDAYLRPARSKHTGAQRQMMIRTRNAGLMKDLRRLMMRIGTRAELASLVERCYNYEATKFWTLTVQHDEDIAFLRKGLRIIGTGRRFWESPIAVRRFFDSRYAEDRIISITKAQPTETRCLTVDVDHSFLADGIVVHNSTYCSRLFPTWWLAKHERKKWLQAGHTQKFAEKEFGKKTRDEIFDNPNFQKVFPDIAVKSAAVDEIILTNGASYVVKGVGQGIAGYRSHFNNIDDPYPTEKSAQSPVYRETAWHWFTNDFRTRRLPGASELIIVTRWHSDDIVGRLEDLIAAGEMESWNIINLPAFSLGPDVDQLGRPEGAVLWPELFTKEFLLDIKAPMVASRWESLYQGSPVASDGNILQRKWLNYYTDIPQLRKYQGDPQNSSLEIQKTPSFITGDPENSNLEIQIPQSRNPFHRLRTVISVDSAEKDTTRADYSAIQCWILGSDKKHYLVDSLRRKFEFPDLVTNIENMAKKWGADIILCETKGAGNQYVQARTGLAPCAIIGYNPGRDDKIVRFEGTMVTWQAGEVLLPERAPWLESYIDQLLRFPAGKNDDDVDATSQYLNWSRADGGWKRGTRKLSGR